MTSVPAVKAALLTGLQARAGLANTAVEWGIPLKPVLGRESIYIGSTEEPRRDNRGPVEIESYVVRLIVVVDIPGESQRVVEERHWAMVGEIETLLEEKPNLGGILRSSHFEPASEEPFGDSQGYQCRSAPGIRVQAHVA